MGSGAGRNSSSSINSNSAIVMKATSQAAADEGRSSRQKAKDKKIFRRMMDVQTTAAANVDSDDIVWSDMRRDAEMECRKVSCVPKSAIKVSEITPTTHILYRSLYYQVICTLLY